MNSNEAIQKIQLARSQGKAADLSGIDLRVEQFQSVDLSEVDFSGANLSGTEFLACDLTKCKFQRETIWLAQALVVSLLLDCSPG